MSPEDNKASCAACLKSPLTKATSLSWTSVSPPDYIDHSPVPIAVSGVEGFKQRIAANRAGFPDIHFTIE